MRTSFGWASCVMVAWLGSFGCGPGGNGDGGVPDGSTSPSIRITSPAADSSPRLPSNNHLAVEYEVSNFVLRTPGMCMGMSNCGHVHVMIDGSACNAPGAPYNGMGVASPGEALFEHCPMSTRLGPHTITVQLRNDDHSAVMVGTDPVEFSVRVTVTGSTDPSVSITSPLAGAIVGLPMDGMLPIAFAVQNFNLMAAGSCGATPNCGHVHLLVDGTGCNSTGSPYNVSGASSPVQANLNLCPMATRIGPHTFEVHLRDDMHNPIMVAGMPVRASVTATVTSGSAINITSPTPGSSVSLGTSMTVPVAFMVSNFTLMSAGSCGATANCGHLHLLIDGTACNAGGNPYNISGAASPINANFSLCPAMSRVGPHTITLQLRDDTHGAVMAGAVPVEARVMFTTVP